MNFVKAMIKSVPLLILIKVFKIVLKYTSWKVSSFGLAVSNSRMMVSYPLGSKFLILIEDIYKTSILIDAINR